MSSAELYDPTWGRWSRVASMTTAREDANAILLGNGRVLVAGGGNPRGDPVVVDQAATGEAVSPVQRAIARRRGLDRYIAFRVAV